MRKFQKVYTFIDEEKIDITELPKVKEFEGNAYEDFSTFLLKNGLQYFIFTLTKEE